MGAVGGGNAQLGQDGYLYLLHTMYTSSMFAHLSGTGGVGHGVLDVFVVVVDKVEEVSVVISCLASRKSLNLASTRGRRPITNEPFILTLAFFQC